MKKILLASISILLLAAACSKKPAENQPVPSQNQPATTTLSDPTAGWNSYTSPTKYGFSIKYSNDFGFNTDINQVKALAYIPVCGDTMAACAFLPRDKYPGTNFDGAGVSINIDPSSNTVAKCYNFDVSTSEAQTLVADVVIGGVTFKSATGGGGAAGHYDKLQVYRNFKNGMCYEIAQDVVSTQIANYPAGTATQFNETEVWQKLQGVVNTFEYLNFQTYKNENAGIAIDYPGNFFSAATTTQVVFLPICPQNNWNGCIYYSGKEYSGSKFIQAGVSLGFEEGMTPTKASDCNNTILTGGDFSVNDPVTINGVKYYNGNKKSIVNGQEIDSTKYVTYHEGTCYGSYINIVSSTAPLPEFDRSGLYQKLNNLLATLRFTK